MSAPSAETRALLERLFAALDYQKLGKIYCDEGGDVFWGAHREPVLRLGELWARGLARRLAPGGESLYVGAGVAELPALVTEVIDLDRTVRATSLEATECASLNASLAAVGLVDRLELTCLDGGAAADAAGGYDHLSLVSVLDDPENYPVVSGVAYGRIPPVQLDLEAFAAERATLQHLVARLLGGLKCPAVVTTTFEETPWILAAAARLGLSVDADDEAIETAVVGDPLGFLRITTSTKR